MFSLPNATPATITAVTPRIERHGEDPVPAISVTVEMTVANTMLEKFGKGLLNCFYKSDKNDKQVPIDGVETFMTALRYPRVVDSISLIGELVGWKVVFQHGIDESSAIHLGQCKIDGFKITELAEGGTIKLRFRVGTAAQDQNSAGWLTMRVGENVDIQLLEPEVKAAPAEDKKEKKAKAKTEPTAADIFANSKAVELGKDTPMPPVNG
jgi:hypothetical protein